MCSPARASRFGSVGRAAALEVGALMAHETRMTRAGFLRSCGAAAAGALFGRRLLAGMDQRLRMPDAVRLDSWEVVEFPSLGRKRRLLMKVKVKTGRFGLSRPVGGCKDLADAAKAVGDANLLDHEVLHDRMVERGVPHAQLATLDIACWDLHARLIGKPLHALLGTKRTKVLRYGDVRPARGDFSPEQYADKVARYFGYTKLDATKLHFPGAMGTKDSIPLGDVLETLLQVRKAVGPEKILAWDPYPRSAESAAPSVAEAKEILALMDELGYAWIEGPLPPVPFETQIPKYAELMKTGTKQRIQAEGPRSPIGDGTHFDVMKQWVEAGAVNQCSTDAYIAPGLTNALRMLEYARTHPERRLVINLHWAWAPHAHLAMAYEEKILPLVEFPMGEDFPRDLLAGPHLLAPQDPGIYSI